MPDFDKPVESEKGILPEEDPGQLASDGEQVLPGVEPPTEEEELDYLCEQGFGPEDVDLLRG